MQWSRFDLPGTRKCAEVLALERVAAPGRRNPFLSSNMKLLTTAEAAAFLRKPAGTLRYWRAVGAGPCYVKMGKTVLYEEAELVDFVKSNTVVPSVRTEAREEATRVAL